MDIRVSCPHCEAEFGVDPSHATPEGVRTTCAVCGESITVDLPVSDDAPASAEDGGSGTSLTPPLTSRPSIPYAPHSVVQTHESHDQLLEMMSAAEQERREMAWQMTRELLRLREMVEQQQLMVSKLMAELAHTPPSTDEPSSPGQTDEADPDTSTTSTRFEHELDELRAALEKEREVVERLRRSKLELERRATNAEETLDAMRNRGFFDRLLGRDDD